MSKAAPLRLSRAALAGLLALALALPTPSRAAYRDKSGDLPFGGSSGTVLVLVGVAAVAVGVLVYLKLRHTEPVVTPPAATSSAPEPAAPADEPIATASPAEPRTAPPNASGPDLRPATPALREAPLDLRLGAIPADDPTREAPEPAPLLALRF